MHNWRNKLNSSPWERGEVHQRMICPVTGLQGQMVEDGDQATAICKLYVWLRYSASRQLPWQRNYNTQPRILGEAQARLTHAIAEVRTMTADGHLSEALVTAHAGLTQAMLRLIWSRLRSILYAHLTKVCV